MQPVPERFISSCPGISFFLPSISFLFLRFPVSLHTSSLSQTVSNRVRYPRGIAADRWSLYATVLFLGVTPGVANQSSKKGLAWHPRPSQASPFQSSSFFSLRFPRRSHESAAIQRWASSDTRVDLSFSFRNEPGIIYLKIRHGVVSGRGTSLERNCRSGMCFITGGRNVRSIVNRSG